MVFKLNIIAVKLMPEEDIMDLLQFYHAVPVIALYFFLTIHQLIIIFYIFSKRNDQREVFEHFTEKQETFMTVFF
jgi:cytochrome b561